MTHSESIRNDATMRKVIDCLSTAFQSAQASPYANNPVEVMAAALDREGLLWRPLYTARVLRAQLAEAEKMASDMTEEMMFQAGLVQEVWHLALELATCLKASVRGEEARSGEALIHFDQMSARLHGHDWERNDAPVLRQMVGDE